MTELAKTYLLVDDEDTACIDCNRIMLVGSPYALRPVALSDTGDPIYELICVYCEHGAPEYCPDIPQSELDKIYRRPS